MIARARAWCAAGGALLLSALAAAPVHATCGAEGCPIVRAGATSGRFTFDLRYQEVTQDRLWNGSAATTLEALIAESEAHGEVELYTRTRSWVAEGLMRLNARWTLSASLPYLKREHRHWLRHVPRYDARFLDTFEYQGLGDATLLAQCGALQRPGLPRVTLQGGVKLPTGRQHVPDQERSNFGFESHLEPAARPGSGSTDWLAGAVVSQALPWSRALPVSASVLMRWNGLGTDDYRMGEELQAALATGVAVAPRVTLLAQLNWAAHGADEAREHAAAGEAVSHGESLHSGSRSLFLTPGVSVEVLPGLSVLALYQARLWSHSESATILAGDHLLLGTSVALGR